MQQGNIYPISIYSKARESQGSMWLDVRMEPYGQYKSKGWMDSHLFAEWMSKFIDILETRKIISPTRRHLVVLDGHKSHVTLKVIVSAKNHEIDLISLPSHTSHELQPLNVACFKPFKQAFRAYRNVWSMEQSNGRCRKEDLAQWISLSLKKALTPTNIKAGFRSYGIWPLNPHAMIDKMGPSKPFLPMDIEVEEIEMEIMEEGGIPSQEVRAIHYFVKNEEYESEFQEENTVGTLPSTIATSPNFRDLLQIPQCTTRKMKVSAEPIVDYSQSQVLTSDDHVSILESTAEKKIRVAEEKKKVARKELS